MLYTSLEIKKHSISRHVRIFKYFCPFLKQHSFRKQAGICRLCFALTLFLGVFVAFYVTSPSGSSIEEEELVNDTSIGTESGIYDMVVDNPKERIQLRSTPNEIVQLTPGLEAGEVIVNCGVPYSCEDNEFSVHIYTGKDNKDEPKLCVDGKYIVTSTLNGGGRGMNLVIMNNMTRKVTKICHFDTYEKASTEMETLLLTLPPGDIVIILTFDEPTRKLSRIAKLLLQELGSSMIQNLRYRGSWYLITQKGINGFSPYEDLHSAENNGWPKPHDEHFCVPFRIQPRSINPDPLPRENPSRVNFCQNYGNYPVFCDAEAVNEPLSRTPVRRSKITEIYNTPIIVMSGENMQYLPLTLETLIKQSGLNPNLIRVYYLPQNHQVPQLCDLFGFTAVELQSQSSSYCNQVKEAFESSGAAYPEAYKFIILGENAVLAPDFLLYMGQALSLLNLDGTISAVSAFNENGFQGVSYDPSLLYRVDSFTGLAVIIRRDFLKHHECALKMTSRSEMIRIFTKINGDVIVPDVSRVLVVPVGSLDVSKSPYLSAYFSRERAVNYEDAVILKGQEALPREIYIKHLQFLVLSGSNVQNISGESESASRDLLTSLIQTSSTGQIYVFYLHQEALNDFSVFHILCKYFGLFHYPPHPPRGLFQGVLRFMWKGNNVLLVGSTSPFFSLLPTNRMPLTVSDLQDLISSAS